MSNYFIGILGDTACESFEDLVIKQMKFKQELELATKEESKVQDIAEIIGDEIEMSIPNKNSSITRSI